MSSELSPSKLEDAQSLVGNLTKAAARIDKDDLSGLATMHGWCEALAAAGNQSNPQGTLLSEQAASLVHALEALILGEVEDSAAALASIVESVSQLGVSVGQRESDDAVEAKLARVFDDEPGPCEDATPSDAGKAASAETECAHSPAESPGEPAGQVKPGPTPQGEPQSAAAAEPPYESTPLTIDDKEIEFVKAFVDEAGEHIEAVEAAVLEVERTPGNPDKINDLFRPFHTIKGMAGFLHLRDVNCLTHEVETVLDQARKGKRAVTAGVIDLVFEVVDVLKVQIASIANYAARPTGQVIPQPPVTGLIGKLRDVVAGRLEPGVHAPGPGSPAQRTGENLVEQGAVPQAAVDYALEVQKRVAPGKRVGEILIEAKTATPKQVSAAIRPQAQGETQTGDGPPATAQRTVTDQSIRIDTAKLDALVDMVGELVIAQTLVHANPHVATEPKLIKDVGQVTKIVRDVQEIAMAMRMIPIGGTFQKMARLVRDVARKANKQVELSISGEDTELDKNVIQQIGDPLVHMVRNAVDHGIESADVRRARGKPEVGHVHLSARHQGSNIVIDISDDGNGLDPEVLIAKAIEKGLVQPGEELSDQQAYALVFAPGFSTAAQVTDISGRGVGMDVVRRNIEQLRGKVEITSEKGRGSTFSIRLPLTLAIIDGMVVRIGGARFIIPTIMIEQSLRPVRDRITTVQGKGEILDVRGRLVPLIQMGRLFGLTRRIDPCETMVVITQCEGEQIGLVVEELIGQQQVVIKSLGARFEKLQGVSGAAILGDGRVGLILEMSGLTAAHQAQAPSPRHAQSGKTNPPDEQKRQEREATPTPSREDELTGNSAPAEEPALA